ncbi:MAG: hypothetical protein K0S33_1278 [Bacteroidetes bacterium]|jgi:hypothetical protein|nr:hypothetical protein [Bacteroidota bacterium]
MKKVLCILSVLAGIACVAQENRTRLQVKVGAGLANFRSATATTGGFLYSWNIGWSGEAEYKKGRRVTISDELLFSQKGGYNKIRVPVYDVYGQLLGTGGEAFPVRLNYISYSLGIKVKVSDLLYFRLAPRCDYLTKSGSSPHTYEDRRVTSDFQRWTGGISYSFGILNYKKRYGFFIELTGQNNFVRSATAKAGGPMYTNYYGINIGMHFASEKKDGNE